MKITNKILYLFLSFLLAVLLWIIVVNMTNPIVNNSFDLDIKIEDEKNNNLTEVGHIYNLVNEKQVKFSFNVRSDEALKIKKEDFKAYVEINDTTNVAEDLQVKIKCLDPEKEKLISDVNIYPQLVSVRVDDLQTKLFYITTYEDGVLSNNTSIGNIICNPTGINVTAIKEVLDRIAYAKIKIDLDDKNDTFAGVSNVELYDVENNVITNTPNLFLSDEDINYTVIVNQIKEVILNPVTVGEVMNGCVLESVEAIPPTILISGPKSYLDNLTYVDLPTTNITGASESKIINTIDSNSILLPSGISCYGKANNIDIKVNVSGKSKIIIAPKVVDD